jgi:hypothetical protein
LVPDEQAAGTYSRTNLRLPWFMNGGQITQSAGVGFVGSGWTIQSANAD